MARAKSRIIFLTIVLRGYESYGKIRASLALTGAGSQTRSYFGRGGLSAATPLQKRLTARCCSISLSEINNIADLIVFKDEYDDVF